MSVIAPNGDAVACTSTINTFFGNKFMSPSTGVIMNNDMDDFSYPNVTNFYGVPPSPNNFARAGKRPLSAMSPTVVVDNARGRVRLVSGAAGGPKITTMTALVSLRNLWLNENIKEAVDGYRIHHQLAPMEAMFESESDPATLDFLASRGHELTETNGNAVVCAVAVGDDDRIYANADKRKDGAVDGF